VAVALEFALPGEISLLPWWTGFQFVVFDLLTGLEVGLLLHLASVIPQPARWFTSSRWLPAGYYVIGAAIAGVTALSTILTELEARAPVFLDDIGVVFINSWVLPIWSATVAGILAHQVVSAPTKRARSQAILIFLGILPWMGYQVVYQYVVPMGDAAPGWLAGLQTVVLLIFPLTVFIAIFKFHLLDIEFVLRRGLAFVLVTAAMVALFGTVFGLGTVFFGSMSDPTGSSVAALSVGMLALGLLFAPVRAGVQRLVDRRFFPESLKMTELLSELAAELPSLGSLPAMARHLVAEVDRVFGVSNATLLVADPDSGMMISLASSAVDLDHRFGQTLLIEPDDPGLRLLERGGRPLPADQVAGASSALARRLHAFDAELVVGLTSREALVGVLLLGPKVGGERFRSSEIEMLNLFSHAAATVVENVRLFESATYESLTGLLRRETIIDKLVAELQRSTRYGRPLSVGMVDIDHFKRINDSYGHLAGDALLKHVARELDNGLRTTDSIGRYGGEEFLFVLPETDLESARVVAEKLRSAIDDMESPLDDEPGARVTVSIGLASVDHEGCDEMTAEHMILLADQALLEAKRTGRNKVVSGPAAAA